MNATKRWILSGLLLVAFAVPVFAFECGSIAPMGPAGVDGPVSHRHNRGYGPAEGFYSMASRLDLSKEQINKLRDLRERQIDDLSPLRNELLQRRLELRRLFTDPTKDEAAILGKQREMEALVQKLHEKTTQFRLERRRVLTPEQVRQLNEIATNRGFGRCPG